MCPDNWLSLYRGMYFIRRVEEKIAELYSAQEMRCPVHLCIGQEAVPVGVCANLEPADAVFSTHRSHGHFLAKGGSLESLLAELYGRKNGCGQGKGGSMHLIDLPAGFLGATPILGATIPLAVGAGWAAQMRKERRVSVAFFGDAAIEEGVFYESANFAVLNRVPVVFVCENNGLSTTSPLSVRQPPGREIATLARGIGLWTQRGDGNDVLDVCRRARDAIEYVRNGQGPSFLEFETYRWREHCGPNYDVDLGYRSRSEVQAWEDRCPIKRLRQQVVAAGAWNQEDIDSLTQEVNREVDRVARLAQSSSFPDQDALTQHEFAS